MTAEENWRRFLTIYLATAAVPATIGLWELVCRVIPRVPTPSDLIRRSRRVQPVVAHFLNPCVVCPHKVPRNVVAINRRPHWHTARPS